MKKQVVDYVKVLKKNGYVSQEFEYNSELHIENQKKKSQLQADLTNLNIKIMNTCFFNFVELFQALLHLKVMRVYVDGVLRFGIPPKFFIGIIKPMRNQDAKLMKKLEVAFAEEHLKDLYGKKEEAQDEDFFPYVVSELTSPVFLMQ
jgi:V-type H+-transporting ATPase subunit C